MVIHCRVTSEGTVRGRDHQALIQMSYLLQAVDIKAARHVEIDSRKNNNHISQKLKIERDSSYVNSSSNISIISRGKEIIFSLGRVLVHPSESSTYTLHQLGSGSGICAIFDILSTPQLPSSLKNIPTFTIELWQGFSLDG